MIDKEKFIRDIRKDLKMQAFQQPQEDSTKSILESEDLDDIFRSFFTLNEKANKKYNIYTKCKINKEEAKNGCTKTIKYNATTFLEKSGKNKKQKRELKIRIPQYIKDNQQILIRNEGNTTDDRSKRGDLIVTINVK